MVLFAIDTKKNLEDTHFPLYDSWNGLKKYETQKEMTQKLLEDCFREATNGAIFPKVERPSPSGKPFFLECPWEFNVSHSGNYGLCGVGKQPLGVDIQMHRTYSAALIQRVCSEPEVEWLERHPKDGFTLLWVLKESYVKATGVGVGAGRGLPYLQLPLPRYEAQMQQLQYEDWYLSLWRFPKVVAGVCTKVPEFPKLIWR